MTEATKPAPDAQPLVGASEAASIMGVELSTFSHLRRREEATADSKFPKPIAVLRCGPIWKTAEVKRFAARYTAPRPGPKPAGAEKRAPIKKVVAKAPAKAVARAAAGNGGENPAKKVAAKKAAPVKKAPAKRVARKAEPAAV